jgi:hypothetical protein
MKLIGLSGPKGVGKSTISTELFCHLSKEYPKGSVWTVAFAEPLKEICEAISDTPQLELFRDKNRELPELEALGQDFKTPRKMSQTVGTIFRKYNPNFWVTLMHVKLTRAAHYGVNLCIIDDVRYENEADLIRQHNGVIYECVRSGVSYTREHSSEMGLPSHCINKVINLDEELDLASLIP